MPSDGTKPSTEENQSSRSPRSGTILKRPAGSRRPTMQDALAVAIDEIEGAAPAPQIAAVGEGRASGRAPGRTAPRVGRSSTSSACRARCRLKTSPARSANSSVNVRASGSSIPWNSTPSMTPSSIVTVSTPDGGVELRRHARKRVALVAVVLLGSLSARCVGRVGEAAAPAFTPSASRMACSASSFAPVISIERTIGALCCG